MKTINKTVAILGTGTAKQSVIETSLADLEGSRFIVPWYGKPGEGLASVYDFLLDNEATFDLVAPVEEKVNKHVEVRADAISRFDDVDKNILTLVKAYGGNTVLLLWDDADDKASESRAVEAHDAGFKVLDLGNGLKPIQVNDEPAPLEDTADVLPVEEEEKPAPPEEEEVETASFSREELENMPVSAVKRQAKANGIDVTGRTKAEIIDIFFPEGSATLYNEIPTPPPAQEPTVKGPRPVACIITYSNGTVANFIISQEKLEEVVELLGRG